MTASGGGKQSGLRAITKNGESQGLVPSGHSPCLPVTRTYVEICLWLWGGEPPSTCPTSPFWLLAPGSFHLLPMTSTSAGTMASARSVIFLFHFQSFLRIRNTSFSWCANGIAHCLSEHYVSCFHVFKEFFFTGNNYRLRPSVYTLIPL